MAEHWHPVVTFVDESESFVHGFEAGLVWAQIEAGAQVVERTVHAANQRLFRRMAGRMGYRFEFERSEVDGWAYLRMEKCRPACHLQVVS
jgi:hypothetical protein